MTTLRLPADLGDRYAQLADDLDGFDGPDELARYVLDATADELARGDLSASATDGTDADTDQRDEAGAERADDDVVADRLEQLGYLEK